MYVCGPTTYAPAHIGHAYSAIAFDTIRRSLEFLGWDVTLRPQRHRRRRQDHQARARDRRGSDRDVGAVRRRLQPRHGAVRRARARRSSRRSPTHIAEIIAVIEQPDRERPRLRGRRRRLLRGPTRSRRTASCRSRALDELEDGRARSRSTSASAHRPTSRCGRRRSPASRRGTRRGARAGRAGTSSARR